MTNQSGPQPALPPLAPADELERCWRRGQPADVHVFLARTPTLGVADLVGVLLVDQRERWRRGERPAAEEYLGRYPAVRADADGALDVVYGEFLRREERSERPDLAEYTRRFPELAEPLRIQVGLHQALPTDDEPHGPPTTDWPTPAAQGLPGLPQVPGYEVLGELGRGGMGVVYKARQTALDRLVALKVILAGAHAGAEQLRRFQAEAEAVARLRHPNVVQVYDSGVRDGWPYLVLEFVEGGTLAQKIAGNPQPPREAARAVETLAAAMHQAHRAGLVHRDLKPANVLLTDDGVLKITDFGLVKRLHGEPGASATGGHTRSGALLGTPAYMAPEQVGADSAAVEPATDVYALGVILYELLTGRPPFQGDSVLEVLRQVKEQEPRPPSRLRLSVPRDLETICLKCLQKEPARRYATAAALAEDLRRFQSGEPILARPISHVERMWRWCRRRPLVAGLTGAVAVLLMVVGFGLAVATLLRGERDRAQQAEQEAKILSHLRRAAGYRQSGEVGRQEKALEELKKALQLNPSAELRQELRNEALACLALFDLRVNQEWDGLPAGTSFSYFDGALERYACIDPKGVVSVHRAGDGAEVGRLPGAGYNRTPWLSPDGRLLGIGAGNRVQVWDLARTETALDLAGVAVYDFSADGRQLAAVHRDGTAGVYDLASGQRISSLDLRMGGAPKHGVALNPRQRQLAVACDTGVQVRDVDTGRMITDLRQETGAVQVAWHAEGRMLAAVGGDRKIYLWDVPSRKTMHVLPGDASGGTHIAASPAGDLLAGNGWDGVLRLWDVRTGRELFSTRAASCAHRFSRDGRRLAPQLLGTQLRTWEVVTSRGYRTLICDPGRGKALHRTPAFHPHARLLAVAMTDGVTLWDPDSGTELGSVPSGPTWVVLFEPSGALLTSAEQGVQRWPVQAVAGGALQIGPPEPIPRPGYANVTPSQVACSADGAVLAVAHAHIKEGGLVLHRDRPDQPLRLAHQDVRRIAVSPDGRYVATASFSGFGVKIWDAQQDGKLVETLLPAVSQQTVAFSPDGKRLATGGGGCRLWAVGSWQEGATRGGEALGDATFAFSPDSQLLAVETGQGVIRLIEPDTGRERARLTNPDQLHVNWLTFSPDGARLAARASDGNSIHLWDLRALDEELARLGFAGDELLCSTAGRATAVTAVPLAKVTVQLGDPKELWRRQLEESRRALAASPENANLYAQRGRAHHRLGQLREAVADFGEAIRRQPRAGYFLGRAESYTHVKDYARAVDDLRAVLHMESKTESQAASACNELAWVLVMGPAELRRPDEALPLTQKAIRLSPKNQAFQNTLGVVYYRLGQYDAAIETLQRSLADSPSPAHDLFFLALSYQRLGQAGKAQDCHDQARHWWDQHRNTLDEHANEELSAFDAEWQALPGRSSGQ